VGEESYHPTPRVTKDFARELKGVGMKSDISKHKFEMVLRPEMTFCGALFGSVGPKNTKNRGGKGSCELSTKKRGKGNSPDLNLKLKNEQGGRVCPYLYKEGIKRGGGAGKIRNICRRMQEDKLEKQE